ncbi:TPA: lysis protein [Klebsiella quasipneumoniae subsp. similipneumoniae]|uniref:lysis system i-spanin subunit Rz n=1 Tax=Klebsiella oxytoca TaxID=571 RepID=UPI0022468C2D|nr:lysis system i-spanin subunit Rz [Klebsiella oxytoca]MCW9611315.1 lysis system i-spanin subunit Rz [Klebsiella oxytoca]MCW9678961.1 lysis system i-spanin subunit Rz [Klebsiella oxytoca]HBZ7523791.1 lysis protein [Klebsiella quasipneumoniae subsp. similipneumoniae]HBZ8083580.1 lysis protein [Klebsiella quasipneumoniae subsp. similipneumoniae]
MMAKVKFLILDIILVIFFVVGAYNFGHSRGVNDQQLISKNEITTMKLNYQKEINQLKEDKQNDVNQIKKDYQAKLDDLQGVTDGVIDSINNDNKRLQLKVKRCSSPETGSNNSSTTGQSDATAELSEGSSRFLVGQSIKADEWIKHLQQLVLKLNEENKELKNKK